MTTPTPAPTPDAATQAATALADALGHFAPALFAPTIILAGWFVFREIYEAVTYRHAMAEVRRITLQRVSQAEVDREFEQIERDYWMESDHDG